jgi:hypothetical protein
MHLGLERKEVRMTRAQVDQVIRQLIENADFVASVRNHVAIVDDYIASLHPDVPENLEKRPNPEYYQHIEKAIFDVTGKTIQVVSINSESTTIDTSLNPGVYFIRSQEGYSQRFVVTN